MANEIEKGLSARGSQQFLDRIQALRSAQRESKMQPQVLTATEYSTYAGAIIHEEGRWPGTSADVAIAAKILANRDYLDIVDPKAGLSAAIDAESPEVVRIDNPERREQYLNEVIARAEKMRELAPELNNGFDETPITEIYTQVVKKIDPPTHVLDDGTKEWENEAGELHRDNGPALVRGDGTREYYQYHELHREDGPAIEHQDGTREYYQYGKLHREDGPAIERADGYKAYYQRGELSRPSGPTIELPDGTKEYWEKDLLHRDNGPAVERADGYKVYYQHGQLHRDNGPAVEYDDGSKEFYQHGQLHREDGPAVEYEGGAGRYYLDGKEVPEREVIPALVRGDGTKEWHNENGELHRENGPAVQYPEGSQVYYQNGQVHRDDGPAVINEIDGEKKYYQHGQLHRDNGPAVEYDDGSKEFYQHGQLHREDGPARIEITDNVAVSYAEYRVHGELHRTDGPAIEADNGRKEYYQKGKLHREDGPAVETPSGVQKWYLNDRLHRTDGPAIEKPNGDKEYYLNGQQVLNPEGVSSPPRFEISEPDMENIKKANEFMDRPIPASPGAARDYCAAARKTIAQTGQWPGQSADVAIAKTLLLKGHDQCRVIDAIQGKSPETIGRIANDARSYAKTTVERAHTPEIRREKQRSASLER